MIDAAETQMLCVCFLIFYSIYSSAFSHPAAYITHNAAAAKQWGIWGYDDNASGGWHQPTVSIELAFQISYL